MNVNLPNIFKVTKKQKIIYIVVLVICALSVLVAFYIQFFTTIDVSNLIGITSHELGDKSDEQTEKIKADFDQNFTNETINDNNQFENKKDKEKALVYTNYEKIDSKINSYDIDVHIPYINIENATVDKYNEEIRNLFEEKAKSVLESQNKNTIYTVEYVASINEDILSIMIRSNLKEGSSAQRVIIQTYNYDLMNNKEITLSEFLTRKEIQSSEVQSKIDSEIKVEQEKVEALEKIGYSIYKRDINDERYKIENTKEFYFKEDTLYIIYAYGNDTFTSEIDIVIL